jgi:hypothetical protein
MSAYSSMTPPSPYEPHTVAPVTVYLDAGYVEYFTTTRGTFIPDDCTPEAWSQALSDALDSCELSDAERATVEAGVWAILNAPTVRGELRLTLRAEIDSALRPYPEAVRVLRRIPLSEVRGTVEALAEALRGINDDASTRIKDALNTLDSFGFTL